MKKLISLLLILILSVTTAPSSFAAREVTIYVAGDSTAQTYDAGRAPLTGWGQKLQDFMPEGIKVANHAVSGRSSKSYVDEGRLATVLSSIKDGDYFLIQFGHNDQSNSAEKATDAETFKNYLKQYIDGARQKKAIPILVSSMERRRFDKKGTAIATLADRAQAMKELAEAENVEYIDIQAETLRWWNYLGPEKTKEIFLYLSAGESSNYPLGISDDTHMCENGATLMAQLIANKLGETDTEIADKFKDIKSPVPVEAKAPGDEKENNDSENKEEDGVNTPSEEIKEKYDAITKDNIIYRDAAKEAQAIGIMNGYPDGSLGENDSVSRAETASLLDRVINFEKTDSHSFKDVPANHWASESIAGLSRAGIIAGYNGFFYPDKTVSFAEFTKMLVNVLGYGERAVKIGEYPYGYLTVAAELGITKDIDLTGDESVTRGIAAKMLINSLRIKLSDGTTIADRVIKNTYYISENGSDENDGSYENPWLTLSKASEEIKSGDTIIINNGIYDETEDAVITVNDAEIRCVETNGAKVTYPGGKGIKVKGDNIKISGIYFEETASSENENCGIITVFGTNADLCENEISGVGILLEGAKNAKISNNIIRDNKASQVASITVTGKAENCAIWNNSIISEGYGAISAGVKIENSTNLKIFNNTVTGTANGVFFGKGNADITLKNNIFANCSEDAYAFSEQPKKFISDYNFFSNTYPRAWEKNSSFKDPLFDDSFADWRLTAKSPAKNAGENLSSYNFDFTDRYGVKPIDSWHVGAYQKLSDKVIEPRDGAGAKLLYSETFGSELKKWKGAIGSWNVKNGKLVQSTVAGRTLATYTGGYEWGNYMFTGEVVSPLAAEGNCTGIVFRADKSMNNFYTFRFYEDTHLEFAVWRDGVFESLDKWEYKTNSETFYTMGVRAKGKDFTFYINGEEVRRVSDDSHASGSVGFYAYRQSAEFDNATVEAIK